MAGEKPQPAVPLAPLARKSTRGKRARLCHLHCDHPPDLFELLALLFPEHIKQQILLLVKRMILII